MALVQCAECGREMSADAAACPHCGKPGIVALRKKQDSTQAIGCAIMIVGTVVARGLLGSAAGAAAFLVGLALVVANTRLR